MTSYPYPAIATLPRQVLDELDWRTGLWRSARGRAHEAQAVVYLLDLLRQHYPASHPRVSHWERKLALLQRGSASA